MALTRRQQLVLAYKNGEVFDGVAFIGKVREEIQNMKGINTAEELRQLGDMTGSYVNILGKMFPYLEFHMLEEDIAVLMVECTSSSYTITDILVLVDLIFDEVDEYLQCKPALSSVRRMWGLIPNKQYTLGVLVNILTSKYNQTQVGLKTGLSQKNISSIVRGNSIKLENYLKLQKAFPLMGYRLLEKEQIEK